MRKFNLLPALLLVGGLALGSSPAGAVEQARPIGPATVTTQPASPAGTEVAAAGRAAPLAAAPGAWRSLEGCIPPAPGEWSGYDIWNAYICPPGTPGAVD